MSLQEALESGKFVVTAEIAPPKGTQHDEIKHLLDLYDGRVDAINATDNQSAVMRMNSLALSKIVLDHGYEAVLQMTCRDRNRLALQSDLLGAMPSASGCRCHDRRPCDFRDHKQAKPVYDVESVQLLQIIRSLNEG